MPEYRHDSGTAYKAINVRETGEWGEKGIPWTNETGDKSNPSGEEDRHQIDKLDRYSQEPGNVNILWMSDCNKVLEPYGGAELAKFDNVTA